MNPEPPYNLEAERACLCGCILDNDQIDEISQFLKADDFYREAHQVYWRAMTWLRTAYQPIDGVTLAETLIRFKLFEKHGGDALLEEIACASPHAANTRHHADIVRELSVNRKLIDAATETIRECYARTEESRVLLSRAESRIFAISEGREEDTTITLAEMLARAKMLIDSRRDGEVCGVMTGFPRIDTMTGGFRPGQLIIVAARPGQGKTAMAMQLAMNAGDICTSLVFSMEMSHEELGLRTLSTLSGIDSKAFDDPSGEVFASMASTEFVKVAPVPRLTAADDAKLIAAICEGSKKHVLIDDRADVSVMQIASKARRIKRGGGLGVLVIDYLSLVNGDHAKGESRQEEVAKNSRAIKKLARGLGVPIILLSQLNRNNEARQDKRPMLSDLRESGQVEQDADVVVLLHRPEYYDINDRPGVAEVIVAKNRNGPTGTVRLTFRKEFTKFIREEREYEERQTYGSGAAF